MPRRFVFRQIQFQDIEILLRDGEIRCPNHPQPQHCHQCSHPSIVSRRNHLVFEDKSNVNDYVAFYFSPITAYNFTICCGNVVIIPPASHPVKRSEGMSDPTLRLFLVCAVENFRGQNIIFSNTALNTTAHNPQCSRDLNKIESIVPWKFFDEEPRIAKILQIGYGGAHYRFNNIVENPEYCDRRSQTMAEFLVKSVVPINAIRCLLINPKATNRAKNWLHNTLNKYKPLIPVYENSDFFFCK